MPISRGEGAPQSIFSGPDALNALQFLGHPGMIDLGERTSPGVTSPRQARAAHNSPTSEPQADSAERWKGVVANLGRVKTPLR